MLGYDREVVGQTASEIRVSARLSHIMARAFVIWVRRSVAKPVRLGKEPSKPWRKILVLLHGAPSHARPQEFAGNDFNVLERVPESVCHYAQVIDDQTGVPCCPLRRWM